MRSMTLEQQHSQTTIRVVQVEHSFDEHHVAQDTPHKTGKDPSESLKRFTAVFRKLGPHKSLQQSQDLDYY